MYFQVNAVSFVLACLLSYSASQSAPKIAGSFMDNCGGRTGLSLVDAAEGKRLYWSKGEAGEDVPIHNCVYTVFTESDGSQLEYTFGKSYETVDDLFSNGEKLEAYMSSSKDENTKDWTLSRSWNKATRLEYGDIKNPQQVQLRYTTTKTKHSYVNMFFTFTVKKASSNVGMIIGIAVGVVLGVALVVGIIVYCFCCKRSGDNAAYSPPPQNQGNYPT